MYQWSKTSIKMVDFGKESAVLLSSTHGRAAEETGNARAEEWDCIMAYCVQQQKKSPKQPNLLRMSHSPQASQNPGVHKLNLEKKDPAGKRGTEKTANGLKRSWSVQSPFCPLCLPQEQWLRKFVMSNHLKESWKIGITRMEKPSFSVCYFEKIMDQHNNRKTSRIPVLPWCQQVGSW